MTSCAASGCDTERVAWTSYCPVHGPADASTQAPRSAWSEIKAGLTATPTAAPRGGRPKAVCPHCQTVGSVTAREVKQKQGISGGKATGAVLTGGVSMLATGLSRKQKVTEMKCSNCKTVWHVA